MGDREDLTDAAAVEKLRAIAKGETAMLCTFVGTRLEPRPMAIQDIDDDGSFWFFSDKNSHKNRQIAKDPRVQILLTNGAKSEYLSVEGTAEISRDQARIDELWTGWAKTWFTEGKDDPALTLIKVTLKTGHYWDTKHNRMIQLAKIAIGAVTGQTMDDGREGLLHT